MVVCKISGPPILGYTSHSVGLAVLGHTRIPQLQSESHCGTRWVLSTCIPCHRPTLQNCRHHETRNFGHHRHRSIDRDRTNKMTINKCTSLRSHTGKIIIPSPTTIGGKCRCTFLWRDNSTFLKRPLFAQLPLGSPHERALHPRTALWVSLRLVSDAFVVTGCCGALSGGDSAQLSMWAITYGVAVGTFLNDVTFSRVHRPCRETYIHAKQVLTCHFALDVRRKNIWTLVRCFVSGKIMVVLPYVCVSS